MGWSGGTPVARRLIWSIKDNVSDPDIRCRLYQDLYDILTDRDWDCVHEAYDIDSLFDEIAGREDDDE